MLAWLLVLHTLGVILWVAGVFGAGRAMLDRIRAGGDPGGAFRALEKRLLLRTAHPGMTLALLAGGAALATQPGYYLGEAWMWAKLIAAAFAIAATVVLTIASRRLETPGAVTERAVKLWRGLFMGAVAAVLVLVFVKPL